MLRSNKLYSSLFYSRGYKWLLGLSCLLSFRVLRVLTSQHLLVSHMQLLSDSSGGRVDIHHGDALEVDMVAACQDYVRSKNWEEGKYN